uniref:Variable large protein n=1 Tax=Acrobeloides nanus TaxID=290746 RepID=A0A914E6G7_9BILA
MAGGAEAAKNFLESAFNKTKEVVGNAAISTKGLADVAIANVSKIIPGQAAAGTDPNAAAPPAPGTVVNGQPPAPPQ